MFKRVIKQLLGVDVRFKVQVEQPALYVGSQYGGWDICPTSINENSIVYSFGVGEDISFDLGLIEKYDVQIFAFDPTPKSIKWVKGQDIPKQFQLFEYGIADYDGETDFFPPDNPDHISYTMVFKKNQEEEGIKVKVMKLDSIMQQLGHTHIDILKMDIEGAEYSVINDFLNSKIQISQILIEFHHRFENIDVSQTKSAIENLNSHGYEIFAISPSGEEYSFIKTKASQ